MSERRRLVSLAELVAVIGVIIAGLSLYLTWADRREAATEKAGEAHAHAVVQFDATAEHDGKDLRLSDPQHKIATISLRFPAQLAAGNRTDLADPVIAADTIADPLLAAAGDAGAKQGRVPVLITANWWDADTRRTDQAIYDLRWHSEGHLIGGRSLRLYGLTLVQHGGGPASVEARWSTERPR
jgi:hypothetical protein